MFKFLREKLKGAIEKITKKVEEQPDMESTIKEEVKEIPIKEERKKEKKLKKIKEKKSKETKKQQVIEIKQVEVQKPKVKEVKEDQIKVQEPAVVEEKKEKHGFFDFLKKKPKEEKTQEIPKEQEIKEDAKKKGFFEAIKEKVTTKVLSEKQFEEIFWDLEVTLLENNVAVEVIEKIKKDLKGDLTLRPIKRDRISQEITQSLKKSIEELFDVSPIDIIKAVKSKNQKPYVIVFVGINGSGKSTTVAKFAHMLQKQKITCVLAACDTFRAAAIHQLEEHAKNLGIRVIKHDYGADAAAVAFDAISHAKAKAVDVVLIDTAGRLHTNTNLIEEMKKIVRVSKPDLKIFVGESITGNDFIEQAKKFDSAIGIDGIVLAKADIDEKGGAAISVSYVTQKPILYIGTGQDYSNLEEFSSHKIVESLGI